jgi:hypothetical protein
LGGGGLGGGVVCGSPGVADVSVASMEELIREPGESGSLTEKLEAARFIVDVVAGGAWARTQGANATSRASAATRMQWIRCVGKARWLRVELKMSPR